MKQVLWMKDYVGQDDIKRLLQAEMGAAANGVFPHTLIYGSQGLGKSSLGIVLGNELNYAVRVYTKDLNSPKAVKKALLDMSIEGYSEDGIPGPGVKKSLLLIEEIHGLKPEVLECFYSALQSTELREGGEVSWLPYFTMVATTTDISTLPKPFRDRFGLELCLRPYSIADLMAIIKLSYPTVSPDIAQAVAERSRGTARLALRYIDRVINYGSLDVFRLLGIDEFGLDTTDHLYLQALRDAGRPLSLSTLAGMTRTSPAQLQSVVEPFLLETGRIIITPRGRELAGQEYRNSSRGARLPAP